MRLVAVDLVGLVGLIRGRNRQFRVGLRRGPPEAHLEKAWKIKGPVGLVGLVGLFHPYACAHARVWKKGPEKAPQPHQAHPAQEIRGFQVVGLEVGFRTEAHQDPAAAGRS
jgi:hypothetical protein